MRSSLFLILTQTCLFTIFALVISSCTPNSALAFGKHKGKKYKPCYCGNVQGREHPRYYISHRPYQSAILPFTPVTVQQFASWKAPKSAIPEGKTIAREDSLVLIEGVLSEVRVDLVDCDIEFTIASLTPTGKRSIIARLPNNKDYCDLRDKVNQQLKDSCGVDTLWELKDIPFKKGAPQPRIKVLAYPFYDEAPEPHIVPIGAPEGTKPRPTRKPMWELRPVQDITIHRPRN